MRLYDAAWMACLFVSDVHEFSVDLSGMFGDVTRYCVLTATCEATHSLLLALCDASSRQRTQCVVCLPSCRPVYANIPGTTIRAMTRNCRFVCCQVICFLLCVCVCSREEYLRVKRYCILSRAYASSGILIMLGRKDRT
jgi:hypothetical protein